MKSITKGAWIGITGLGALLTGCFDVPGFIKAPESSSTLVSGATVMEATVLSDEGGVLTAEIDVSANVVQQVSASENSEIKGASLGIKPGSLAIPTNIVVEAGIPESQAVLEEEVGLTSEYAPKAVGAPAVFTPTVPQDPLTPLSISLPVSSGLALASGEHYTVVYRVKQYSTGKTLVGAFSQAALKILGDKISFDTPYFGQFSLYRVAKPVVAVAAKETTNEIVTKQTAQAAPLEIKHISPLVVPDGGQIVLSGVNFRPTFRLAMNGAAIQGLQVSDSQVAFQMPKSGFGFQGFKGEQDGKSFEFKLFAQLDRKAYPIATIEPAGMCQGVKYYDALGNERVGTKDCTPPPPPAPTTSQTATTAETANFATTAGHATSSDTAGEADYALGRKGADIVAASSVTIPEDGTYHEVFGSTPIDQFNLASRAGIEVTLYFHENVILKHRSSSPTLILPGGNDLKATMGDFATFISTPSGWVLSNLKKTRATHVHLAFTSPQTIYGDQNDYYMGTYVNCYYQGLADFDVVRDDLSDYDGTAKTITIQETGQYTIEADIYATNVLAGYYNPIYFEIQKNGSYMYSIYANGSSGVGDYPGTYQSTMSLIAGDEVSILIRLGTDYDYDCQYIQNNYATFNSGGTEQQSFFKIVKQ